MIPIDEALQIIRHAWSSNGQFLDDLKDRLTAAQPIPLVPFVGAGFSMPMGFPSWSDFLNQLATECRKTGEVSKSLANGRYPEAAEIVQRGLRASIFNDRILH